MNDNYDVIVIGSGIGGLVAALTCARAKRSVLVLEAGKQFGGYTNPFQRRRFHFDPGIHYIGESGEGGSFRHLLDRLGLDVTFEELDPDGFDHYVFPNYRVKNCRGLDRFRDRLAADFPRERDNLDRFFRLLSEADIAMRASQRRVTAGGLLRMMRNMPGLLRWSRATLAELLSHYFDDPTLMAALSGPVGDLGLSPSRLSALMHIGLLTHYANGAFVPSGGGGALRDAFLDALKAEGADLVRNCRVDEILHDAHRATGVRTATGVTYRARSIISNAQATTTYRMVGLEHLGGRMKRKVNRTEHSCGSLVIFLGVDGALDTSAVGSANIWNYGSTDIDAMFGPAALERAKGSSYFLTVPTNKDPNGGLAPEGKQTVELVTLCDAARFERWFDERTMKRGAEYEQLKQELADHYLELAETHLPGLRDHIEVQEVATPATNFAFTLSPEGNIYGPAHTPSQSPPFRYSSRTPIDGLFLCGASVISAGIVSCAASGRTAGKLALGDLETKRWRVPGVARRLRSALA